MKKNIIASAVAMGCLFANIPTTLAADTPTSDAIVYHVTFPYSNDQTTIDTLGLNTQYASSAIMSNIIAGVMYTHMIKKQYPELQFNEDDMTTTLLGQLLQESGLHEAIMNTDFSPNQATQAIHNPDFKKILLSAGQGGPYQINDYSKRLPDANSPGSLGLINYDAVRKTLDYTIADQDSGKQTSSLGPDALDDMYFAPMTAAFYRFNDINRMKQLASNDWYVNKEAWDTCWTNLSDPLLAEDPNALRLTDFILNVVYNAGSYSAPLQSYLNVCVKKDPAQLANMNNYNLSPQDYRDAIGSSDTTGDTYYRYPRQVSFYIDQLFGVNLEDAGLNINNQVSLLAGQFNRVFAFAVTKLSYKPNKDKEELTFVTASQADKAFKDALAQLDIKSTDSFTLSNDSDRKAIYQLLDVAIGNVEKTIGSDFNAVTDKGPIDPTSEIQIYTDAKIQGQMFLSASKAGANLVNNWMTPNTHISLPVDASIDQMKDSGVDCTAQAQSAFAKLASEADPEHPQQINVNFQNNSCMISIGDYTPDVPVPPVPEGEWDPAKVYDKPCEKVLHNGLSYHNQWYTTGEEPTPEASANWGVWRIVGKDSDMCTN